MSATDSRPTAVILLAGASRRTWPLTAELPKPLLPLWNTPLTVRVLDQLAGIVDKAVLVVGYEKERILEYYRGEYRGIRLIPVEQPSARGTADALRVAAAAVRTRVLVINGDDFYHADDLARVAEHPTAILCKEASDPWNRSEVSVTDDDWLTDIVEKPPTATPGALASIGAYSLRREDLAQLGEVGESVRGELELPDLIRLLIREPGVRAVRSTRPWVPLTYPWDLISRVVRLFGGDGAGAEALNLETSRLPTPPSIDWEGPLLRDPSAQIHPAARVRGPLVIGPAAKIRAGAQVERTVLLQGAQIGKGAVVSDSVLGPHSVIGEGAVLRSAVLESVQVLDHTARIGPTRIGACLGEGAFVPESAEVPPGTLLGPDEEFEPGEFEPAE